MILKMILKYLRLIIEVQVYLLSWYIQMISMIMIQFIQKNQILKLENFKSYLAFVAIKNGEHNGIGYLTSNFDLKLKKQIKLTDLKSIIKSTSLKFLNKK